VTSEGTEHETSLVPALPSSLSSAAGRGEKLRRKEMAEEKVASFCCFATKRES